MQYHSNQIYIEKNDGKGKKIGIVQSLWNYEITQKLYNGCYQTLLNYGVSEKNIKTLEVPGSFELIYGSKQVLKKHKLDAIIVIGSIIKGETPHFNFIAQSISDGIKDLNILFDIPFIFCVLTDLNKKQAIARCGGKMGNKGADSAIAAIQLLKNC